MYILTLYTAFVYSCILDLSVFILIHLCCLAYSDEWSSQMLFSDSCVVNELPVVSANANTPTPAGHHYHHHSSLPVMDPLSPEDSLVRHCSTMS